MASSSIPILSLRASLIHAFFDCQLAMTMPTSENRVDSLGSRRMSVGPPRYHARRLSWTMTTLAGLLLLQCPYRVPAQIVGFTPVSSVIPEDQHSGKASTNDLRGLLDLGPASSRDVNAPESIPLRSSNVQRMPVGPSRSGMKALTDNAAQQYPQTDSPSIATAQQPTQSHPRHGFLAQNSIIGELPAPANNGPTSSGSSMAQSDTFDWAGPGILPDVTGSTPPTVRPGSGIQISPPFQTDTRDLMGAGPAWDGSLNNAPIESGPMNLGPTHWQPGFAGPLANPPVVPDPLADYPASGYPTSDYPTNGYPTTGYPAVDEATAPYPTTRYPTTGYPTRGLPADTGPHVGPIYDPPAYEAPIYDPPVYASPVYGPDHGVPGTPLWQPSPSVGVGVMPGISTEHAVPGPYWSVAPPLNGPPIGIPSGPPMVTSDGNMPGAPAAVTDGSCSPSLPLDPFSPDPDYSGVPFDPQSQINVYDDKYCFPAQRPLVELGKGMYRPGPIPPSPTFLGDTNPISTRFILFGDYRTALAYNDQNGSDRTVWAHQLNLDFDFRFTGTERIHAFYSPLVEDGLSTRVEAADGKFEIREAFDDDFDTLFFEGDLGYIWGGFSDQLAPFDLPFVAGKFPMLLQNGVWMFDVLEGFAFTLPARHSTWLDISNYDITFFFAFDDVDSPVFAGNDNAANVYGGHTFVEAWSGYFELGYAFVDDSTGQGLSYHNIGMSYSRRYFHRVSNALRVLVNTGQSSRGQSDTADGALILLENSFITSNPNFFVPYLNVFAGIGRPQSVARAAGAGGVLFTTGINFETDNITGYPSLDPTAQNTWGAAVGVNLLGPDFRHQLVAELATVQVFGDASERNASGDQYAVGLRYQMPINNAWLVRFDAMHGLLEDSPDITGARAELRCKF
ncbi:MAG: hypothetical protein KDA60_08745 [Planctomycetales bacterium]|nr:hypothetical protein [Planctomycetales bacterium]